MLYRTYAKTTGGNAYNGICYRSKKDAEASARDLYSRWMLMTGWEIHEISEQEAKDKHLSIQEKPTIYGPNHRVQL